MLHRHRCSNGRIRSVSFDHEILEPVRPGEIFELNVERRVGQRAALAPLQSEWPRIEGPSKLKWLEVAARLPALDAHERERVQIRMAEWVRLSPAERGRARLQFQETRQLSSSDRKERWQAYQALAPDQRQALAAKASPAGAPVAPAVAAAAARTHAPGLAARVEPGSTAPVRALISRPAQIQPQAQAQAPGFAQDFDGSGGRKRNLIGPATAPLTPPQAIGPTVLQARPGATTSLMTRPIEPPAHHQAGLPKIAASRGFVDPATLLPQRGPQGAAVVRPAPPVAAPARAPRETQ